MSLDLEKVPGLSVRELGHCTTCYGDFDDAIQDVRDEVVRVVCERVDAFAPPNLQPFSYSRLVRAALAAAIGAPPEHVARQALVIAAARAWALADKGDEIAGDRLAAAVAELGR